jgi:D-sedoheptulose 7-phosphate isomerase
MTEVEKTRVGPLVEDVLGRHPALESCRSDIFKAFLLLVASYENSGTFFVCGNGGSASDAEHIAGDLLKEFRFRRSCSGKIREKLSDAFGSEGAWIADRLQPGLRTIALTGHPSFSTAYANDVEASIVFAQQLFVLGKGGDVLMGITTSGNSLNVLRCLRTARAMDVKTIVLTGETGGKCVELADCCIRVPERETYRVQELHLPVYHLICSMLERHFHEVG